MQSTSRAGQLPVARALLVGSRGGCASVAALPPCDAFCRVHLTPRTAPMATQQLWVHLCFGRRSSSKAAGRRGGGVASRAHTPRPPTHSLSHPAASGALIKTTRDAMAQVRAPQGAVPANALPARTSRPGHGPACLGAQQEGRRAPSTSNPHSHTTLPHSPLPVGPWLQIDLQDANQLEAEVQVSPKAAPPAPRAAARRRPGVDVHRPPPRRTFHLTPSAPPPRAKTACH